MKIIEALKELKAIDNKIRDLMQKVADNGADLEHANPTYGSVDLQTEQINSWMQAIRDLIRRKEQLKLSISKTNNVTQVTISLGGKDVTKSITEWIQRRKEGATHEAASYNMLLSKAKSIRPETIEVLDANGNASKKISNVRRYFNVKQADAAMQLCASEPPIIDGKLEVVNATTDLVE